MLNAEAEEVAVGLRPDRRRPPGVGQQTDLPEVRAIAERGRHFAVGHHNINNTFLYKVHLVPNGTFLDDNITCIMEEWSLEVVPLQTSLQQKHKT